MDLVLQISLLLLVVVLPAVVFSVTKWMSRKQQEAYAKQKNLMDELVDKATIPGLSMEDVQKQMQVLSQNYPYSKDQTEDRETPSPKPPSGGRRVIKRRGNYDA